MFYSDTNSLREDVLKNLKVTFFFISENYLYKNI